MQLLLFFYSLHQMASNSSSLIVSVGSVEWEKEGQRDRSSRIATWIASKDRCHRTAPSYRSCLPSCWRALRNPIAYSPLPPHPLAAEDLDKHINSKLGCMKMTFTSFNVAWQSTALTLWFPVLFSVSFLLISKLSDWTICCVTLCAVAFQVTARSFRFIDRRFIDAKPGGITISIQFQQCALDSISNRIYFLLNSSRL